MAAGGDSVLAVMSCAVRTGGAKLNAGTASDFLRIRTGLTSTVSRSVVLALTLVAVANNLARSCLALAAARFAFFRADLEGDSLVFPRCAMF